MLDSFGWLLRGSPLSLFGLLPRDDLGDASGDIGGEHLGDADGEAAGDALMAPRLSEPLEAFNS